MPPKPKRYIRAWLDPIVHKVLCALKGDRDWPNWLRDLLKRRDKIFLTSLFDPELYFFYAWPSPFVTMERDELQTLAEGFWHSVERANPPRTIQLNIPVDERIFKQLKTLKLKHIARMNKLAKEHPESKPHWTHLKKNSWPEFFTGFAHSIIDPFILSEAARDYPKIREGYIRDFLGSRRFNLFNAISDGKYSKNFFRPSLLRGSHDLLVQFRQLLEDYARYFKLDFEKVLNGHLEQLNDIETDPKEIKKGERALRAFYKQFLEHDRKRAEHYRQLTKGDPPKAQRRSTKSLGGCSRRKEPTGA